MGYPCPSILESQTNQAGDIEAVGSKGEGFGIKQVKFQFPLLQDDV